MNESHLTKDYMLNKKANHRKPYRVYNLTYTNFRDMQNITTYFSRIQIYGMKLSRKAKKH